MTRDAMVLRPRLDRNRTTTKAAVVHRRDADEAARGVFARSLRKTIGRGARYAAARASGLLPRVPGGPIVAALVVAGAVAIRLGTGRSFGNMGENITQALLGDLTAETMAKIRTRDAMQANGIVTHAAGSAEGITKQMRQIGDLLYEQYLRDEKSKRLFMTDKHFQTNGLIDMIALRLRDKIIEMIDGADMSHSLGKVSESLRAGASLGIYSQVQKATGVF